MQNFIDRHDSKIAGVLSCYDRVVITGTIPGLCYAEGMTSFLYQQNIRIFDYTKWAEPLQKEIRTNAEKLAFENNLKIEFIRRKNFRKEDRIQEILEKRGNQPGLVCIFSAMESCSSYKPWHDKESHRTFLKNDSGRCLHYYFYFIDPDLGLCYVRVPTWAPFRLQFYFNGHNELEMKLKKKGIEYKKLDNSFVAIENFDQAQFLADSINPKRLNEKLNQFAKKYCPVIKKFTQGYYWSLMQVEYATDIIFHRQTDLAPIYEELIRTATYSVKPENIATFLGRKLTDRYQDEMGNNFNTRIEGTRLKHHMGKVSIKMYDKFNLVLRIETTSNDVKFFKHHRWVEHRDGTGEMKNAPVKKSIFSLSVLTKLMKESNCRYLEYISSIDDPTPAILDLKKVSEPTRDGNRSYRGFNLFHGEDQKLFEIISRGEFNISGFRNKFIRQCMPEKTSHQISRMIKRLHKHGLIKKIGNTYKYYLTKLGRRVISTGLKLKEMYIIPTLRGYAIAN